MAVSVISTYNNQYHSPGFDLVVTGLSGYSTLTIERVDPSGEFRDIAVRGADDIAITGSTFAITDYEAPVGRTIVYRATAGTSTFEDTFNDRTASNGWGRIAAGRQWFNAGGAAADYSVSGGAGRHSDTVLNAQRITSLDSKLGDFNARWEVIFPLIPTGGQIVGEFLSHFDTDQNQYRYEAGLQTDGSIDIRIRRVIGGTGVVLTSLGASETGYVAGTLLSVRVESSGGTKRMKAWKNGDSEPGWQITTTDSTLQPGRIGFLSIVPTGNTNTLPISIAYNYLTVSTPGNTPAITSVGTSSPVGVEDDFSRNTASGWGTPLVGPPWQVRFGPAADFLTDSGVGRMSMTQRSVAGSFGTDYIIESPLTHTDIDQKVRVRTPLAAAGDLYRHSLMARETSRDNFWNLETNYAPSGEVRIRIIGEAAGATRFSHFDDGILIPGLTHTPGTWYWLRFQAVGNQLRGKVWQDGSTEPLNWHIEYTDSANPSGGYVGVRSFSSAFSTNPTPDIVEWEDYSATLLDVATAIPADNAGTAWLKSVSQPALSRRINMVDFAERSTPGRILGEFQVLGRANKVVLRDTLGGREGTFSVATFPMGGVWESDSSWREVQNLLAYGGTLLLQTAGSLLTGEVDMYFELKNVNRSRVGIVGSELIHLHAIDYVEVDRPATIEVSLTLRSWQSVLDQGGSWQDVLDNHLKWLDALQRNL